MQAWPPADGDERAPVVICAVGGSGTRVLAGLARDAGLFIGEDLNRPLDSVPGTAFVRSWAPRALDRPFAEWPESDRIEAGRELAETLRSHRRGIPAAAAPWAIKNPRWIYLLPLLAELVPGVRIVHVIRDGRDMAFSRNQAQLRDYGEAVLGGVHPGPDVGSDLGSDLAVPAIALWAQVNLAAADCGLGSDQYLPIRFEDLCARPEAEIARYFAFIGATEADPASASGLIRPPDSIGRWRERDPALLARMRDVAGEALTRFGYAADGAC